MKKGRDRAGYGIPAFASARRPDACFFVEEVPYRSCDRKRLAAPRDYRRDGPFSQKGGDPAALSSTTTLLRLHPPHETYLRRRPPLQVGLTASGASHSDGVTGGVYKARERIHRAMLMRDY